MPFDMLSALCTSSFYGQTTKLVASVHQPEIRKLVDRDDWPNQNFVNQKIGFSMLFPVALSKRALSLGHPHLKTDHSRVTVL